MSEAGSQQHDDSHDQPGPSTAASQLESRWLKTAGEAIGLIAGVAALIYLLGGVVYAIRLAFDGFSLEAIVGLIGQLPRESVITAGFVEGLGPAVFVGVLAALVYGALDGPKPRDGLDDRLDREPNWGLKLVGLLLLTLVLVAPAISLAISTQGASWETGTGILPIAVTYSFVCTGWFALRILAKKTTWWYRLGQAVAAGMIWMGMALVPSVMFGAAIAFESGRVCTRDSAEPRSGQLIAQTKEHVLLATGTGNTKTVVSLPSSRVRRVEFGDLPATTTCPPADPKG
jgi:hypothetical protein